MASFPTSLPSFTNPTATDYLNSPAHATQHGSANDELVAVATKIGTGASTPTDGTYLKGNGIGTSAWTSLTINRAFAWYIDGTAIVANEVGAKYIAPQDMTVVKIWYKLTSGTCTIRIQKDTTDIDAGNDVTSTLGSTTSISDSAITAGEIISLDITAASSPVGLIVCMECTQP